MKIFRIFLFFCALNFLNITFAGVKDYILPRPQNDKDVRQIYRLKLLQLALDKTEDEYGAAKAQFSFDVANHKRAIDEIVKNTGFITVIGTAKTKERIEKLELIDFEILNKINYYRISFVNKNFLEQFENAQTVDVLKKMPLCRKKDWFDGVYEPNGFRIEFGSDYEGIFKMLNAGRCAWFARGINEIYDEYEQYKNEIPNVVIDEKIAIKYTSNMVFFVSKENKEMAQRIKKGLDAAKQDGSFEELFNLSYKEDIKKSHLETRRVFELKSFREE